MEDLGSLLVFLHPFIKPTERSARRDLARYTYQNTLCGDVIPYPSIDDR